MRNEIAIGAGRKSPCQKRRRGRRIRSSNFDNLPTRCPMVPNSAEDHFIRLERTPLRQTRQNGDRNSKAHHFLPLPLPFGFEKPSRRHRHLRSIATQKAPNKPKTDEKHFGSIEERFSKGDFSSLDRPIPARPSNPLRFKTELCRAHEEGGICRFGAACTFAHGNQEMRFIPRHQKYKTEHCKSYHSVGYCQYGIRCHFIHDDEDPLLKPAISKQSLLGQYESFNSIGSLLESIGVKCKSQEDDLSKDSNSNRMNDRESKKPKLTIELPSPLEKSNFMDFFLPSPIENSVSFSDMFSPSPIDNSKTFANLNLPPLAEDSDLIPSSTPVEKSKGFLDWFPSVDIKSKENSVEPMKMEVQQSSQTYLSMLKEPTQNINHLTCDSGFPSSISSSPFSSDSYYPEMSRGLWFVSPCPYSSLSVSHSVPAEQTNAKGNFCENANADTFDLNGLPSAVAESVISEQPDLSLECRQFTFTDILSRF